MNATTRCPFPPSWTPHEIAGAAVAPRSPGLQAAFLPDPAGAVPGSSRVRPLHAGYLGQASLSARFRIHG